MAARVLSRRALREQNDQIEQAEQSDREPDDDNESDGDNDEQPVEEKVKKPRARKAAAKPPKVKAPPKPRKRAAKVPPRMFAQWAVCDNGLKRVAVFEYRDRDGADAKLAEMLERKPGAYIMQLIKVPLDPPPVAIESVPAV